MAFTLEKSRAISRAGGTPFDVWKATGSAAMAEDLAVDVPTRLEAVYLDVTAGAAAEDLVVDIYDDTDTIVCRIQTKAMAAVTDWAWLPNPRHFLAAGWYLKFTWANGNGNAYVLRAILTES